MAAERFYYVRRNGQQSGPYSVSQLSQQWKAGSITAADEIRQDGGSGTWHPVREFAKQLDRGGKRNANPAAAAIALIGVVLINLILWGIYETNHPHGIESSAAALGPPSTQQQFEAQLKQLHDQYSEASRQRNQMNQRAIEGQMRAWKDGLKASPIDVASWLGTVKKVESDRKLTCTSGVITYHINLAESQASLLSGIGAGKQVTFTGKATGESSITDGGAVDEPEISVEDAFIVVR